MSRRRVTTHNNTHSKVRVARKYGNRRRTNWPRRLLIGASAVLAVECLVALLYSPWLDVRRVEIEGSQLTSSDQIIEALDLPAHQNIVRLPTAQLERRIGHLPAVAAVKVSRRFPNGIQISVTERHAWASVPVGDGRWFTIDESFVPFHATKGPQPGCLRIFDKCMAPWEVVPGLPLRSEGLSAAQRCEQWAKSRSDFPLDHIVIDPKGKVCLNRVGGLPIFIGSEEALDRKLASLSRLLQERPELSSGTSVAYVNLFAADAPAIKPVGLPPTAVLQHQTQTP